MVLTLTPVSPKTDHVTRDSHRSLEEVIRVEEDASGLLAFIVIDSTVLGPAAGGTRTAHYASLDDALSDACALARAMTYKCALGGLDAGGAKAVIIASKLKDREAAFAAYGQAVATLGGRFRTAGDFGTTGADLAVAARHAPHFVHGATDDDALQLAQAVGKTVLSCATAALGHTPKSAAVQGVGAMGEAVARTFAAQGSQLTLCDLDADRAASLAAELGAKTCAVASFASLDVDVLSPCAKGGVVDIPFAKHLRAKVVCGAANCLVDSPEAERLAAKTAVIVPDLLSSSGAVIAGVAQSVMRVPSAPLLDAVEGTCARVLSEAKENGALLSEAAIAHARARLRHGA